MPDPRKARGIRYPLAGVLAMAVVATIAGARSFAAIGQWCAASTPDQLAAFDHEVGAVLGQVCVDAKSNEIPPAGTTCTP